MSVDAMYCACNFYSLEALKLILMGAEFGKHSAEKLFNDIVSFQEIYSNKLSQALFDYSTLACFGEMRHAKKECVMYAPQIKKGVERNQSYSDAKKYNADNILIVANKLFGCSWSSMFGGKKWQLIAQTVAKKGKISNLIYCDTCFSLSHNTSPYLNKSESGIFRIDYCSTYKSFLDTKFQKTPLEILEYTRKYMSREVRNLVKRAGILGYIPEQHFEKSYLTENADMTEKIILSYKPIIWGNKLLSEKLKDSHIVRTRKPKSPSAYVSAPNSLKSTHRKVCDAHGNEIHIGDEIIVNESGAGHDGKSDIKAGMKGIIKEIHGSGYNNVGIEFYEFIGGHSLINCSAKDGHGWNMSSNLIEKTSVPKTISNECFNIGDEVEVIKTISDNYSIKIGMKGIIKNKLNRDSLGIEFYNNINGYNIGGYGKNLKCWYVSNICLKKVNKEVAA